MSLIVAGTKYRGEFEGRIKQVIDEASKMENEVILFIDEIHTIIGAGSGEGGLDAANILKPAMARGKICLIGATTISEYQKYIEKDTALERRFQKIDVCEPSKEVTIQVLHGIRESFEEFHNLIIDDSAIADAVALSTRYITDRFLPDKAIDLIDEACSAKSMTYNIDDSEVVDLKSQIQDIQKDIDAMVISAQYNKAIDAKKKVDALSAQIQERKKHTIIPREKRMHISARDVQMVIHRISGVPLKNLEAEDRAKIQSLADRMSSIIIGQDDAIKSITSSLKRSRMGISSEHRPI
jgi:ATP-dependent Clp protease ATP-binding subunit ClpC